MPELFREYRLGDLTLTDHPYSVRIGDTDLGAPSLTDEPREMSLVVGIEGTDLLELAEHEAALAREINKDLNEFTVDPGDGFAPASVFETTAIEATPVIYEDGGEQTCYREWRLSIEASPHVRSADPVIAEPLSVGGSPIVTVFDTCDSATGWSADVDGVPEGVSTAWEAGSVGVFVFSNPDGDADTLTMTRLGDVDFTGTPYLIVDKKNFDPATENLSVLADGEDLAVLDTRSIASGRIRYTLLAPAGTVSRLDFKHSRKAGNPYLGMYVFDLTKSNIPPGATERQVSRIIPISGTQRTTGSVHVASTGTASPVLGATIVHIGPEEGSGYSPPLRRWRTAGNTVTTDSTKLSGAREPLKPNPFEARVPTSATPEDDYLLAGFISSSAVGATRIFWTVRTLAPDGSVHSELYSDSTLHNFGAAGPYDFVPLGIVRLPVGVHNAGITQIQIQQDVGSAATLTMDEAWVFRVGEESSLTVISEAQEHVWLDTPSLTTGATREWTGTEADRSDAYFPPLAARGNLILTPDLVSVFVASANASYPDVTIEHYARWHTHAAS
ncbi:hypothetical protein [Nocardioides terrigena]|uniref:hypothetical protein n=1 Tax=Nocardioides terrigena TaxID=424797 RepID=UPI000D315A91|nr:hypothetical protein [Nocardioides terrigena]